MLNLIFLYIKWFLIKQCHLISVKFVSTMEFDIPNEVNIVFNGNLYPSFQLCNVSNVNISICNNSQTAHPTADIVYETTELDTNDKCKMYASEEAVESEQNDLLLELDYDREIKFNDALEYIANDEGYKNINPLNITDIQANVDIMRGLCLTLFPADIDLFSLIDQINQTSIYNNAVNNEKIDIKYDNNQYRVTEEVCLESVIISDYQGVIKYVGRNTSK